MIDVPNSLIGAIGQLNATKRNWAIEKQPEDDYYIARIGSRGVVKKHFIDDLIAVMLEIASKPDSEQHVIGFDTYQDVDNYK